MLVAEVDEDKWREEEPEDAELLVEVSRVVRLDFDPEVLEDDDDDEEVMVVVDEEVELAVIELEEDLLLLEQESPSRF